MTCNKSDCPLIETCDKDPEDCDLLELFDIDNPPPWAPSYATFTYKDEWRSIPRDEVYPIWTTIVLP